MTLRDDGELLGGLGPPRPREFDRTRAMRCTPGCSHTSRPCELDPDLVAWARSQPTGGFVRCELGPRVVFVPPESCLERVEGDAAHVVVHQG